MSAAVSPPSIEAAGAEAMALSQSIIEQEAGTASSVVETQVLRLLYLHDEIIVPPLLANPAPSSPDAGADTAMARVLTSMQLISKAFSVACTHLPLTAPINGKVCTWQRLVETFARGAAHPALPVPGRALLIQRLAEVVAVTDPAHATDAAIRQRADAVAEVLVRLLHALHAQSAHGNEEAVLRLERLVCADVLQLPASSFDTVACDLVDALPQSLDGSLLLVRSPGAGTALYEAMERALYARTAPGAEAAPQPHTPEVTNARATLTDALRERFVEFGYIAAQHWCNALLATPDKVLFQSLRSVERHVEDVVEPLLHACEASRAKAVVTDSSTSNPAPLTPSASPHTRSDHLVRDSVPIIFLCRRFASLWEWYQEETHKEGSALVAACAAAALRLGRAYAALASFTHTPSSAAAGSGANGDGHADEEAREENSGIAAAESPASSPSSPSALAALIPTESELNVALSPLKTIVDEAEECDRERRTRRTQRNAVTASNPPSSSSDSESSSSASSSDEDDDDDETSARTAQDRTLPAVLDAPLPLLECHLHLFRRLLSFVALTGTPAHTTEATTAPPESAAPQGGTAGPARTLPSARMLACARATHALHYHLEPTLKDILSLAKIHADDTASSGRKAPAPDEEEERLNTDKPSTSEDTPSVSEEVPVVEALCRLCEDLWRHTGRGRPSRAWLTRARRTAAVKPSWIPSRDGQPYKPRTRGRRAGRTHKNQKRRRE